MRSAGVKRTWSPGRDLPERHGAVSAVAAVDRRRRWAMLKDRDDSLPAADSGIDWEAQVDSTVVRVRRCSLGRNADRQAEGSPGPVAA